MKLLGLLSLVFFIGAAQASFNEYECDFRTRDGRFVNLDIERAFGSSSQRSAIMSVSLNGRVEVHNFLVFGRSDFNGPIFSGPDFHLEIDLWPDRRPQHGRYYRAHFRTWSLGDTSNVYTANCRFSDI